MRNPEGLSQRGSLFSITFSKSQSNQTPCLHIHEPLGNCEWFIWPQLVIFDKKVVCSCALKKWRPCLHRCRYFFPKVSSFFVLCTWERLTNYRHPHGTNANSQQIYQARGLDHDASSGDLPVSCQSQSLQSFRYCAVNSLQAGRISV